MWEKYTKCMIIFSLKNRRWCLLKELESESVSYGQIENLPLSIPLRIKKFISKFGIVLSIMDMVDLCCANNDVIT